MDTIRTGIRVLQTLQTARAVWDGVRSVLGIEEEPHYVLGRTRAERNLTIVALVGGGMVAGAGLALLFAPTSGRELRARLAERARERRGGDAQRGRHSDWSG